MVAAAIAAFATPALAQRPVPLAPPTPQAQFVAQSGSDAVYFGAGGGYLLDQQARATLVAQALYLTTNPYVRVRIEGHSDELGTREYALGVGERRAAMVRNYLVSLGVEPSRLTVVSWGKERPASGARGPAAAALNRRVVVVLEP